MAAVFAALLLMEAMEVDYETDSDDGSFSDNMHILSGSDSWYSGSPGSISAEFSTESDDQSTPHDLSDLELEETDDDDDDDAPAAEGGDDVSEASSFGTVSQEVIVEVVDDLPLPTGENDAQDFVTQNVTVTVPVDRGKTPVKPKVETNQCSQSPGGEDEGQNCPICFDVWTSSGTHRLISLKCGHLFGLSCIERWLRGPKAKCPQCNASAKKSDIRTLYVKNLKALDTSERDQALRDLEREKELRRRAELENANTRMKLQMSVQECEKLKRELMDHQTLLQNLRSSRKRGSSTQDNYASKASKNPSFVLEKTLDINKEGGCRVLGISSFFPMLVITQASSNKVFAGYGIKKVSTLDMKPAEFVSIHQKPIKDLAFHSYDSLILTTALDKTIKLTNVYSNTVVQTYTLAMDAWSCIWNRDDATCFYAGLKNGTVLQFDTRMTSTHVQQLPSTGHTSPVVGLQYVEKKATSQLSINGPVTLQLSACCFYENRCCDGYKVHPLPVEGNFTSLCLEPTTGHFLVSCRPSVKHPKVTHMFCELACKNVSADATVIDNMCTFNVVQTLHGGSTQVQLSRSKAFLNPANDCSVLVCAGDDCAQAALIWDVNTGQCLQHLKADSNILDVCNFRVNESHFLSTLTERTLRVYRWSRA